MSDLLHLLKSVGICQTIEVLPALDYITVRYIIQELIPRILTSREMNTPSVEISNEDIQEKGFLKLLLQCNQICMKLRIGVEFLYSDLIDPEPKKIKYILTEFTKYAIMKARVNDELKQQIKSSNQMSQTAKQIEEDLILLNNQRYEEKENTKMLESQMQARQKVLDNATIMVSSSKSIYESVNNLYEEENAKFKEKQNEITAKYNQLQVLQGQQKQLQSLIINNPDQIQNTAYQVQNNLNSLREELNYRKKQMNLLQFKEKVFKKSLEKLSRSKQIIGEVNQLRLKVNNENQEYHNLQKQIKSKENQIQELQHKINQNKEINTLKERQVRDNHHQISQEREKLTKQYENKRNELLKNEQSLIGKQQELMEIRKEEAIILDQIHKCQQQLIELYNETENQVISRKVDMEQFTIQIENNLGSLLN